MTETKEKLLEQLRALKVFPNNKLVQELRKQIVSNLEKLDRKERPKQKQDPNRTRSNKLRKYHHYLRLIRDNFPEYSYSQIRSQFSRRKKGQDVSIPDPIWKNPSP
jgi:hypothetical protein